LKSFFYFFFIGSFFVLVGCTSSKQNQSISSAKKESSIPVNNNNQTNLKRYAVGYGGGFNGFYEEYILRSDGKVYKRDFSYDREVYKKDLSQGELDYFMDKIAALALEGEDIDEPGNMSSYIEIREGKISINKLTWGSFNYYPDHQLEKLHQELFEKLKQE